MKHTELETGDKETRVSYTKIHPSGVLESVIALLIVIYALPVSAVLVKGTLSILYPVAKSCEVKGNG
ncbi:hypothetical protein NIES4075_44380 [Tolypothrix sp. NIES-4075]|uniref:hypothetical protein n=1 Tax=Tolypothrix sp. NIES-4075 TaxID=2005459 RepID=UPI000B5C7E35|nr:hypothetical protein [Tolypothrix sp. NIES-4075]GAX43425.1 hypothetical protein NIES4075_44380 [Tolypothrix sp. NIES-4075]